MNNLDPPFRRFRAVNGQDREAATPASVSRQARRSPASIARAAGADPPRWFGQFVVNAASLLSGLP
jgi:hypothetical protein